MRPVIKGANPGPFAHWVDARDHLIGHIGDFCSYCESSAPQPDVEHMEPKSLSKYAHRVLEGDNFLLACRYCNSNKLKQDPRSPRFLFPDEVNTACIFEFFDGGFIALSKYIAGSSDKQAATDTRDLFLKLNRPVDTKGNRDLRWQRRVDVWREAKQALADLQCCDRVELRRTIVSQALGWGCFSVWMTVFASDADMCRRFIAAFPGTRRTCYDSNERPIEDLSL